MLFFEFCETVRAYWNAELEKTLVELLTEHNTPQHKGQNGWSTEVWNKMATKFHERHPHTDYTKGQIQDKEKELKREYKMIKEARQQSGVSWNEQRCMVEADDELWENLIIVCIFFYMLPTCLYSFLPFYSMHHSCISFLCADISKD